jgi:hypothetical protein
MNPKNLATTEDTEITETSQKLASRETHAGWPQHEAQLFSRLSPCSPCPPWFQPRFSE